MSTSSSDSPLCRTSSSPFECKSVTSCSSSTSCTSSSPSTTHLYHPLQHVSSGNNHNLMYSLNNQLNNYLSHYHGQSECESGIGGSPLTPASRSTAINYGCIRGGSKLDLCILSFFTFSLSFFLLSLSFIS